MSTRKRQRVSPERKVAIVRRHLLEEAPVSDLCDEHSIHRTMYYCWHKQLFERLTLLRVRPQTMDKATQRIGDEIVHLEK